MEQEPPWKLAFAIDSDTSRNLYKLKVHYRFHNSAFLVPKESGTPSTTLFFPDTF
jgi:hypothetical protein